MYRLGRIRGKVSVILERSQVDDPDGTTGVVGFGDKDCPAVFDGELGEGGVLLREGRDRRSVSTRETREGRRGRGDEP